MGATYTRQSSYTDGDTITAAHTNDEFDQLLAAFATSTGHTHDGTAGEGGPISKLLDNTLTFGAGTAGTDITITFDGETNDGVMKWMEDEDYFEFSDDILIASTEKLQFRDTAIYINSSADGQLDLVADTEIQIAATTVDINGNADISGNLGIGGNLTVTGTTTFNGGTMTLGDAATDNVVFGADVNSSIIPNTDSTFDLGSASQEWKDIYIDGVAYLDAINFNGTAITATAAEINLIDGGATVGTTAIADGDGLLINDAGTMRVSTVQTLAAYLDDEITAMPNLVTTAATTVGALDSGSITSGFGTIDTGASAITTTGLITGGSLDIDDVVINGTTIGHTDDTDLMTLTSGVLTVAGEVDAVSLDISGDADIDGTLEADAITIGGVSLAETISDTVGAMVTSNTESGIAVTYDDADNTLDFTVGTLNQDTTGNAATATALETARTIHGVSFDGTANIDLSEVVSDTVGAMFSSNTETGITATYQDADNTIDLAIGAGDIVNSMLADDAVGADELAANAVVTASIVDDNVTQAKIADDAVGADQLAANAVVEASIVDNAVTLAKMAGIARGKFIVGDASGNPAVIGPGTNGQVLISDGTDIAFADAGAASSVAADNITIGDGAVTISTSSGNITLDATANDSDIIFKGTDNTADITMLTLDGSDAGTAIFNHDIVIADGGFIGSATDKDALQIEADGDIVMSQDLAISGALNVTGAITGDVTGNADTATTLATARTIGGVSFNGSGNINLPGVNTAGNQNTSGSAATLTNARTIGGVSFNGSANINLPGVNTGGTQATTGNAATATKLATARTINGTAFDGTGNITISAGKVLQCVSDVKTDTFSTATTSAAGVEITGLTQAITPSATNHKVLVMVFLGSIGCSTSSSRSITFVLQRGGSQIALGDAAGSRPRITSRSWMTSGDTNHALGGHSIVFLDDPGTTSAVTYSVHMSGTHDGATAFINRTGADSDGGNNYQSRTMSTITCMEISD